MKPDSSRTATAKASAPKLRIIGGVWRGRKLPILDMEGLRPTGDRLRETLFNWLAPALPGAYCLDLYAGTGALGLEALSRGAAEAVMIERQRPSARQLQTNCKTLSATGAQVHEADALAWLSKTDARPFDVVFVDPPFAANLWQQSIHLLEQHRWLAQHATIYIETPRDTEITAPANWSLHRSKAAGAVCARLYIRQAPQETRAAEAR